MSSKNSQTSFTDKVTITIAIFSIIISFIGLILSENVTSLISKVELVSTESEVYLKPLTGSGENIKVITIKNQGLLASRNIKLVLSFKNNIPKYKTYSDEDIKEHSLSGKEINIYLERLSKNSSITIEMASESSISYELNYIDDTGHQKISTQRESTKIKTLETILLMVILFSLLFIIWTYKKLSESALLDALDSHRNDIHETLREIRDEIGNIEVNVSAPSESNSLEYRDDPKGLTQRLSDFIKINK